MSTSEIHEIATPKSAEAIGMPTTGRIASGYTADTIVAHGDHSTTSHACETSIW